MELNALRDAFEKVQELQAAASSTNLKLADAIEHAIQAAITSIESSAEDPPGPTLRKLNEELSSIAEEYVVEKCAREVELELMFERCFELIDELFDGDVGEAVFRPAAEWDAPEVDRAIARHLYQEGPPEIGDCFVAEARITDLAVAKRTYFVEMHAILAALRDGNTEPALRWAEKHRKRLAGHESDIEAELRQSRDFDALRQGWADSFYRMRKLSSRSPLAAAAGAGFQALPRLLPVARERSGDWQQLTELPEPINLTSDLRFHSTFLCPILQDVATKHNPPRLLPCGHVISRAAEASIAQQNQVVCPYCRVPHESSQVKKLTF